MKHLSFFLCFLIALFACGGSNSNQTNQNQPTQDMNPVTDIHSYARPAEVLMTDLALDIEVDFAKKVLKGSATITLDNKNKATELHLDTKDLTIEKVALDKGDKTTQFELAESDKNLGADLKITITPETKSVTVYYQTAPTAEALQWLSPQQTAGKKRPFLFTQSQAILARSWVPCQDSPGIRFTYSAKVKVPKELMAVMSAENPQTKNAEGIYTFKMPQAIPAYLLALAVGDIAFQSLGKNTGVYAEPSELKKSAYEFADLQKMVDGASALYGEYAWGRYDLIVLPPSFPFGGMENPRLTFATPTILAGDRSLTSLVAHELAHSWSGNLVTNSTWNDFWLNEGFTVYFERRIMESLYGKSYSQMLEYLGFADLQATLEDLKATPEDTRLKIDLKGRNPDDGVTDIAYEKGYFFLRMIEEAVGREKMDVFLKKYFSENAFKGMDTERFLTYLQKALPETDKLNLKEWIYEAGLPKNCPKVKSERFELVGQAATAFMKTQETDFTKEGKWSSHEWVHFLTIRPTLMNVEMETLDKAFKLTDSGNSEILAQWFLLAIKADYAPAFPAMEKFLVQVGRRKFLTPLYKEMMKTEKGKKMAKDIYAKARPNYHFVAVNTLDEVVK